MENVEIKKAVVVLDRICGTCQCYDPDAGWGGWCEKWKCTIEALDSCRSWKADKKLLESQ